MKLGLISDIHEDIDRLKEAFQILDQHACDEVACLGDICGFVIPSFVYFESRNASACLELVRNNCKYIVAGNHDMFPAGRIPSFNAGFNYPENWFSLDYKTKRELANEKIWLNEAIEPDTLLSKQERDALRSFPEYLVLHLDGLDILLSHYLYPDLSGSTIKYYEDFGPVPPHIDFIENNKCQLGFSGHRHVEGFYKATRNAVTHHPFGTYKLDESTQWIIGPCIANGKKKNGCMIFNTETSELEVIPLNTPPRTMMVVNYKID